MRASSLIATRKAEAQQQIEDDTVKRRIEFMPDQSGKGYLQRAIVEMSGEDGVRHVGIVTVWMVREGLRPIAKRIAQSLGYGRSRCA